jgi:hypothetical protein
MRNILRSIPTTETLEETATEINKRLTSAHVEELKADDCSEKAKNSRIEAGHLLLHAKERVKSRRETNQSWTQWCKQHIPNRSMRDINRCMKIAAAEDPEEAAEQEREGARGRMRRHRGRRDEQEDVRPDQDPVKEALNRIWALSHDDLARFDQEYRRWYDERAVSAASCGP